MQYNTGDSNAMNQP